ncbi:MAG TPA: hypothetical protein VF541_04075 [Longimicrobium sp.]
MLALVRGGYYDRGNWHSVEPDFVIQGRGPGTNEYVIGLAPRTGARLHRNPPDDAVYRASARAGAAEKG